MRFAPFFLSSLFLVSFAPFGRADFVAVEVSAERLEEVPYAYTGKIRNGDYFGSGTVVGNPYTVTTAGHLLYDVETQEWATSVGWRSDAGAGFGRSLRMFRYSTSYSSAVDQQGSNSNAAFALDFATAYSYANLNTSLEGGEFSLTAEADLISNKAKRILGFPDVFDHVGSANNRPMGETGPFSTAFTRITGAYFVRAGVSHGSGGSGGGLWVETDSGWALAAVYVSGRDVADGASGNLAGVVALDSVHRMLLEEAIDLATVDPPKILSAPESIDVIWEDDERFAVAYESPMDVRVWWEFQRSGTAGKFTSSSYVVEEGVSYLRLREFPKDFVGERVRCVIEDERGQRSETPWREVRYVDAGLPVLTASGDLSVTVEAGDSLNLTALLESVPAPQVLTWAIGDESSLRSIESTYLSYSIDGAALKLNAVPLGWRDAWVTLTAVNLFGSSRVVFKVTTAPETTQEFNYVGTANRVIRLESLLSKVVSARVTAEEGRGWLFQRPGSDVWEWLGTNLPGVAVSPDGRDLDFSGRGAFALEGYRFRFAFANSTVLAPPILWGYGPVVRVEGQPGVYFEKPLSKVFDSSLGDVLEQEHFMVGADWSAEWQWWDREAKYWRPLTTAPFPATMGPERSRLFFGGLPPAGAYRIVYRSSEGRKSVSSTFEEAGTGVFQMARETFAVGGPDVWSSIVSGQHAAIATGSQRSTSANARVQVVTVDWEDASMVLQELAPPDGFDRSGFGYGLALGGDALYVGAPGYEASGDSVFAPGALVVYRWAGGAWEFERILRFPSASFVSGDYIIGNSFDATESFLVFGRGFGNAPSGSGVVAVFDRASAELIGSIEVGSANAQCLDSYSFAGAFETDDGFLALSVTGPHSDNTAFFTAHVASGLELVDCEGMDVIPGTSVNGFLVGSRYYAPWGQYLLRTAWNADDGQVNEEDAWYVLWAKTLAEGANGVTLQISGGLELWELYPDSGLLGESVALEFTNRSELSRVAMIHSPIGSGALAFSSRYDGRFQVDVFARHAVPPMAPSVTKPRWITFQLEGSEPVLRYRGPRSNSAASISVALESSTDLQTWSPIEDSSTTVIDNDYDGDGAAALRRFDPLPRDEGGVFYRLREVPGGENP